MNTYEWCLALALPATFFCSVNREDILNISKTPLPHYAHLLWRKKRLFIAVYTHRAGMRCFYGCTVHRRNWDDIKNINNKLQKRINSKRAPEYVYTPCKLTTFRWKTQSTQTQLSFRLAQRDKNKDNKRTRAIKFSRKNVSLGNYSLFFHCVVWPVRGVTNIFQNCGQ